MSEPAVDSDDVCSLNPRSPPEIEVAGPAVGLIPSSHGSTLAHPAGGARGPSTMPGYGTPFRRASAGHPHLPGFRAGGMTWQQRHIAGAQMAPSGPYHHRILLALGRVREHQQRRRNVVLLTTQVQLRRNFVRGARLRRRFTWVVRQD